MPETPAPDLPRRTDPVPTDVYLLVSTVHAPGRVVGCSTDYAGALDCLRRLRNDDRDDARVVVATVDPDDPNCCREV